MAYSIDFAGTPVVVIGGTSGINLGVAQAFARQGARVAVASRSQDKVDAAVASLQALGAQDAMGMAADVRDAESMRAVFQQVADAFGPVAVLISGAAGNFPARAAEMSPNAFRTVIDIDLMGTFHVMRAAFPHLLRPGASVINISAPQAFMPMELQAHVCAAKAGVDMLTRVLAMEWGPQGIRVNSISPGPIDGTEGMKRLAPTPELQGMVAQTVPMRRQGSPEDIAGAALFLASPLAAYVSGVVLPVDGGWHTGGASVSMHGLARVFEPMAPQRLVPGATAVSAGTGTRP